MQTQLNFGEVPKPTAAQVDACFKWLFERFMIGKHEIEIPADKVAVVKECKRNWYFTDFEIVVVDNTVKMLTSLDFKWKSIKGHVLK